MLIQKLYSWLRLILYSLTCCTSCISVLWHGEDQPMALLRNYEGSGCFDYNLQLVHVTRSGVSHHLLPDGILQIRVQAWRVYWPVKHSASWSFNSLAPESQNMCLDFFAYFVHKMIKNVLLLSAFAHFFSILWTLNIWALFPSHCVLY